MFLLQQSEATAAQRRVPIHLVDATDGITAETGVTGTPDISKNGAAFAAAAAALTEIGNGAYYVELSAGNIDTLGFLMVRFKSAATAEFQIPCQVVPWDPYDAVRLGLTALPNANAEAAGGLYTRGAGAGQINQNANGQVDTRTVAMSAGVVDAAAIAADAIGASELAADAANEIADALLDRANAVETGFTVRQAFRIMAAALAGKVSGYPAGPGVFRSIDDSANRISATNDADGNRTAMTLTP